MSRFLTIAITTLMAVTCGFAQTPAETAPTKWEKYALPEQRATVLLPKMPIVMLRINSCAGEKRREYGAYSDGVAYVAATVNKMETSRFCSKRKEFDENSFSDRILALQARYRDAEASNIEINGQKWKQVRAKAGIFLLYNDFAHKRWFEFSATGADESKAEVKNFFASLDLDEKSKGVEVGEGSDFVLGDDQTKETPVVATLAPEGISGAKPLLQVADCAGSAAPPAAGDTGKETSPAVKMEAKAGGTCKPMAVVLKPFPTYTESGRLANVSGTVKLKVVFFNNGRVGPITVVTALPNGLTDQAIAAAKKILFVPAKKDDVFISVSKILEYRFTVY
jgi:hypothetical protein